MTEAKNRLLSFLISISVLFLFAFKNLKVNGDTDLLLLRSVTSIEKLWSAQHFPWAVWSGQGFCRDGENFLSYAKIGRKDTCIRRECVYSNVLKSYFNISELLRKQRVSCSQKVIPIKNAMVGQIAKNHSIPLVSFIFTLHNNPGMALASILEVWRTSHEVSSTEFIIFDDGSTSDMSSVHQLMNELEILYGTKYTWMSSKISLGYGASNTQAITIASGKYALLMNSDVMVMPGYLTLLVKTMEEYRGGGRVGMVGPMMLAANGKLLESGGVIHQYGHPDNMGRGEYPNALPYLHARVVDYISAACLLVRRKLFLKFKLFDPQFEPAYYEDTDAAMTMLAAGYITVLQPLAVVLHQEGSTIVNTEKEILMKKNQKSFYVKHAKLLDHYCPLQDPECTPASYKTMHEYVAFVRQERRILFLEEVIPEDDRDSGSIRLLAILQILSTAGYSVTLEGGNFPYRHVKYILRLLVEGINVVAPGTTEKMAADAASNSNHLSINRCPYEVIFIARRAVYQEKIEFVKTLCPHAPIIYDTVDVHFLRELRTRAFLNSRSSTNGSELILKDQEIKEVEGGSSDKTMELDFMEKSNITFVVSDFELDMLTKIFEKNKMNTKIEVLSNIYTIPRDHSHNDNINADRRNGAIFVANMCHDPNVYAIEFIIKQIASRASLLPKGFIIHLVASRSSLCQKSVLKQAEKNPIIQVHTDVSNAKLLALHRSVKLVLAPLPYGAGVKGKVNYGLLHGIPVVASTFAIEGMHLTHGESVWVADKGDDYIAAINHLYANMTVWKALQKGGRKVMSLYFSREIATKTLFSALTRLGSVPPIMSSQHQKYQYNNENNEKLNLTSWTCPNIDQIDIQRKKATFCMYNDDNPYKLIVPSKTITFEYLTSFYQPPSDEIIEHLTATNKNK